MIVIIDYNTGNLGSIQNMLSYLGYSCMISNNPEDIKKASHLILPGVGSFDTGMRKLKKLGLIEILNDAVIKNRKPILGICLGLQLMCKKSDEGTENGLGWIDLKVKKFPESNLPVPHMGWNWIKSSENSNLVNDNMKFYFVHTYYLEHSKNQRMTQNSTKYIVDFTSSIEYGNIFGVQFHPEKSHKFGFQLFENFLTIKHDLT